MIDADATRRGATGSLALAGFLAALFAAALTLRPQVIGIGPVLPRIQLDLAVAHGVAGLLGTIPVLCMGVFAPLTPVITARLGPRRSVATCLIAIGVFGLGRAAAPGVVTLLALTIGIGVALGVAGALLPVAVKDAAPRRPAVATGVYAAGIQFGAAASALGAAPIAHAFGGWRGTLAVFSGLTLAIAVLWMLGSPRRRQVPGGVGRVPRLPLRNRLAWLLAALFCLQSVPYYGLNAWVPAYLIEHGWAEAPAGAALASMNATGLVGTLCLPWLMEYRGSRRFYLMSGTVGLAVLLLALLARPDLGWIWVPLAGLCLGQLFLVGLTLPLDVADRPETVGAVAGLMLGVGYGVAAFAPALLGVVRDVTRTFSAALWALVALLIALFGCAALLSPARLGAKVDGPDPPGLQGTGAPP